MAILYRHIRLDKNQPFYIGIGKTEKRSRETRDRSAAWKAIASKGYEIEILFDDLTWEQALQKEIEFIKLYGRKKYGGLLVNITEGGRGACGLKHTEESKQKMKKSNTEEVRLKKSNAKLGSNNPNFQNTWSDEKKDWMRKLNTGRKLPQESIERIREKNIGTKRNDDTKQKMSLDWELNREKRLEGIRKGWEKRRLNNPSKIEKSNKKNRLDSFFDVKLMDLVGKHDK